jgi:altronate dehydratase
MAFGRAKQKKATSVSLIEIEIELERAGSETDHTSAAFPSLHKGQRLTVRVEGELVYAEVIEAPNSRPTNRPNGMEIAGQGTAAATMMPS